MSPKASSERLRTAPPAVDGGVRVLGPVEGRSAEILTPAALELVARLQRGFGAQREALLRLRAERQAELDAGARPDFLAETRAAVREASWRVAPVPRDLRDRRVEITGPTERKMIVNALNSGASAFMADFEDSLAPTWENVVSGQVNLKDAVARTIEVVTPEKRYALDTTRELAVLMVRPRGWHLLEKHVVVDGRPVSASIFDFALYLFHNHEALRARGTGPYFYLPKLESRLEARLWNDVFESAQEALSIPRGTIKATVLIETILAAFEMDEILYELRDHSAGLNAGRWDFIFSMIKKLGARSDFVLPDRAQVTMTTPFLRAYTELLVKTCHRRGAHAIGGMAAFIPSRKDAKVNEVALAKVREDKLRESNDGFDGTWVAHPDLVPVARAVFDAKLGASANQVDRLREDVVVGARELLDVAVSGARVTEAGLRTNVNVAIQYVSCWISGLGAVAIANLMEDAATAEISRSQVWQWVRHAIALESGACVTRELVLRIVAEETERIRAAGGLAAQRVDDAKEIFEQVALGERFVEFLTVPAYERVT